jgi:hypothetical protein
MGRLVRTVSSPSARRWAAAQWGAALSLLQQPCTAPAACYCSLTSGNVQGSCNACRGCNGAAAPQHPPRHSTGAIAPAQQLLHTRLLGALVGGTAQVNTDVPCCYSQHAQRGNQLMALSRVQGTSHGHYASGVQSRAYWYETQPSAALPWTSPAVGGAARREAPLQQPPVAAVQQRASTSAKPAQQVGSIMAVAAVRCLRHSAVELRTAAHPPPQQRTRTH